MPGKEPLVDRRTWRIWRFAAIGVGGGVLLELSPALIPGLKSHGQLTPFAIWASTIAIVLGVGWAFYFSRRAFHASDEYRRSNQQYAWYRGGVTGIMVATPLVVFFALGGLPLIGLRPPTFVDTSEAFAMGFCACLLAQVVGYAAMCIWRATRP